MRCLADTPWGQCQQLSFREDLCGYHFQVTQDPTFRVDRFYHEKVAKGLVEPTFHWMSSTEVEALFKGRPRHDGRRLDLWAR